MDDVRIHRIPVSEIRALSIALKLRESLADFVDCLILGSAIANCDVLITEDADILALRGVKDYMDILNAYNPGFKLFSSKEFLDRFLCGEDSW